MIALVNTSRMVGKLAVEHAPALLTFSAVGGVGATAFLSARSALRIQEINMELTYTADQKPTKKDRIKASWKEAIPPILMGAATIACILGAHRLHLQRQAAIAAAYSVLSDKYHDYKREVIKEIGPKQENRIQDTIAQNKVNATYDGLNVIRTRFGDVLFMDSWSGRFFYSSYEAVEKARVGFTAIIQRDMSASINEFYSLLEIPTLAYGDVWGWHLYDICDNTLEHVAPISTNRVCKTPTPEELPCVVIDYDVDLTFNFDKIN